MGVVVAVEVFVVAGVIMGLCGVVFVVAANFTSSKAQIGTFTSL